MTGWADAWVVRGRHIRADRGPGGRPGACWLKVTHHQPVLELSCGIHVVCVPRLRISPHFAHVLAIHFLGIVATWRRQRLVHFTRPTKRALRREVVTLLHRRLRIRMNGVSCWSDACMCSTGLRALLLRRAVKGMMAGCGRWSARGHTSCSLLCLSLLIFALRPACSFSCRTATEFSCGGW